MDFEKSNKLEKDYKDLILKANQEMNQKHNYLKAYDFAVTAYYLAEKYLHSEEYKLESSILKGLVYIEIDRLQGHEFFQHLFNEYWNKLADISTDENNLRIRFNTAFAYVRSKIGEYTDAIGIYCEIIRLAKKRLQAIPQGPLHEKYIVGIISCMSRISYCLINKSRQTYLPFQAKLMEERIKSIKAGDINEVQKIIKTLYPFTLSGDANNDLREADNYINEALDLALQYDLKELELILYINFACILGNEKEYVYYRAKHDKYKEMLERRG